MHSNQRLKPVIVAVVAGAGLFMTEPAHPHAEATAAKGGSAEVPRKAATPVTEDDKAFYTLGLELAQGVSAFSLSPHELDMVQAGLSDGTLKNKDGTPAQRLLVDKEQFRDRLKALAQARQTASARKPDDSDPMKEALKEALKEKGARRLLSGVIYTNLRKVAHGRSPSSTDTVRVHYRGTLVDGTEFDSSYKRDEPAVFPLNGVIPCWTQGVAVMKIGEKARLVCPSDTAYGDRGSPPQIPGGATLVFEIELLGIEP
jgi:FKBP-type peptidyl-prolyl cis-trans isomerase FkpA